MNKSELIERVKHSSLLFTLYHGLMSVIVNVMKPFIKKDEKLILFVSYGGRYYNDSPKCVYEAMLSDKRYEGYRLVWAFRDPKNQESIKEKIKIDTIKYYVYAMSAACWVTNVSIERGLPLKRSWTYYFYTTHVTLPKLSGYDWKNSTTEFKKRIKYLFDTSCAQSVIEKEYQKSMFALDDNQIIITGYPKNDILCGSTDEARNEIIKAYNLPNNKKILLYAPTYREDSPAEMLCPIDFKKWEKILSKDWILLFRAHPVVANATTIDSSTGFMFDVSGYTDNSILLMASDALISDYSGIFFEYAVLRRPMFCYAYDYEEYQKRRGLYFDLRDALPGGRLSEHELLELVACGDESKIMNQVNEFADKYVTEYGNATLKCVDYIYSRLEK